MNKLQDAACYIDFGESFTKSVNEMIDDGELESLEQIKEYLAECLLEDLEEIITKRPSILIPSIKYVIKENKNDNTNN